MPRMCSSCSKTAKKSASRSHAMNKTLRRQKPNLQKVNGELVCTRCIKTQSKKNK